MAVETCFLPTDNGSIPAQHYYVCDLESELPSDNLTADLAFTKDSLKFWKATGPGSWVEVGGSSGGGAAEFTAENKDIVTIKKGQPVTIHSSGTGIVLASAANSATLAIGLAAEDIAVAAIGTVTTDGPLTNADWTDTVGAVTLTTKRQYYLSVTAGMLTLAPPSSAGQFAQPMGNVINPSTLELTISEAIAIG